MARRLIDAVGLKIRLGRAYVLDKRRIMEIAKEKIDTMPTVDAVEVVRCKDCFENDNGFCYVHGHGIRDDEFCSWGVKENR